MVQIVIKDNDVPGIGFDSYASGKLRGWNTKEFKGVINIYLFFSNKMIGSMTAGMRRSAPVSRVRWSR